MARGDRASPTVGGNAPLPPARRLGRPSGGPAPPSQRPCLTQALVLQYLLLRRGDDAAELHIGVRKDEDTGLQAHAWVERSGQVLIGGTGAPDTYERFEDLGAKLEAENTPNRAS
ncbi:lasso peptide biosynthesis B2 protein [Salinibacter ruber]|uniref:lasso peptide biosynthesis B2 protein n=1 Tax=Salinibacter ruber TaxID=146919 RepID=UPI0020743277|nr:lasso peptide biosynthesis B2 protein [Salinibacter ruber]